MPDPSFFHRAGPFMLGHLAGLIGGELVGGTAGDTLVDDVARLEEANERNICLFADARFAPAVSLTKAASVVTTPALATSNCGRLDLLLVKQPRIAFAMLQQIFYPDPPLAAWIAPQAVISPAACIGAGCRIEPGVVIEGTARIGEGCHIGANTVIGDAVTLGAGCRLGANVTISHALVGDRVHIFANTAIGRPGFGFAAATHGLMRMPQLGRVVIDNDVEIGSACTIDRGALGDTHIGAGCKIDNGVQIGHNVKLGKNCILAGHVGIAGSVTLEDFVVVGGGVTISDYITIGTAAQIAIGSCVIRDIAAKESVGGYPAVAVRRWHRQTVAIGRLAARRAKKEAVLF